MIHSYYNIIYYIPYALHPCDYSVTTSLHFSVPSPFSPSLPAPSPLAAISLFSVPVRLFLFCLFIYIVLQILHISEIMWYLSFLA